MALIKRDAEVTICLRETVINNKGFVNNSVTTYQRTVFAYVQSTVNWTSFQAY